MTPRRHFFDWASPLAPQAARWLLEQAPVGTCPDLSNWAVLVPTAEAGRRLRAALLRASPDRGLLPPATLTPVQFLEACAQPGSTLPLATREERLLAWCSVLLKENPALTPALFPEPPARQDFPWARDIARLFLQTQTLLIENGWTFALAARHTGLLGAEERWENLVRLEKAYYAVLHKAGRDDSIPLWLDLLKAPQLPDGIRNIALIGTPDPVPALLRLLGSESLPGTLDVLIHAPESEAEAFDSWGRPTPEIWNTRPILDNDSGVRLHLSLTEEAQARLVASAVAAHHGRDSVVIGLGREDLAPSLDAEMNTVGVASFDPAGSPALRHPLWAFLDTLQRLLSRGSFNDLLAWVRHPATVRWLNLRLPDQSPTLRLEALDRFSQRNLPQTWREIATLTPQRKEDIPVLDALNRTLTPLLEELSGPEWITALRTLLGEAHVPMDKHTYCEEAVRAWLNAQENFRLPGNLLRPADRLALFIEELSAAKLPEDRPDNAVEFKGWLELGWDDRPHLLITGFQEGGIPRALAHDLFLNESLRGQLGLRTADQRFACDVYQLKALYEQRRSTGRLDLLFSRFTPDGDPLLPSRLLFLCPDTDLPERVRQIFETPVSEERLAAPTLAFTLQPVPAAPPRKVISVTHFRDYLESPFYYYLGRLAKWEALNPDKQEMDPLDYGTLAHDVLERFGKDPKMSLCDDPEELARYLSKILDAAAQRTFGQPPPLSVEIQLHSLHNRFAAFARHQAEQAALGWRIESVEQSFELPLEGWTIRGKIDRIDRHPDGRVRLLDYKTSDKAEPPDKAHVKLLKREPDHTKTPPEALAEWDNHLWQWRNLQLPLYFHEWCRSHPEDRARLHCGYIQLPEAVPDIGFTLWDTFDAATEQAAVTCATRVLEAIDGGRFWPPLDIATWNREPWNLWLPGGPRKCVEELVL